MNPRIPLAALAACVLATGAAACGSSDDDNNSKSGSANAAEAPSVSATLNGAGSTFAAPIYQQINADLKDKRPTINYQGVGSGAGVSQFAAGTVDFAGSDLALADEDKAIDQEGRIRSRSRSALGAITASTT